MGSLVLLWIGLRSDLNRRRREEGRGQSRPGRRVTRCWSYKRLTRAILTTDCLQRRTTGRIRVVVVTTNSVLACREKKATKFQQTNIVIGPENSSKVSNESLVFPSKRDQKDLSNLIEIAGESKYWDDDQLNTTHLVTRIDRAFNSRCTQLRVSQESSCKKNCILSKGAVF